MAMRDEIKKLAERWGRKADQWECGATRAQILEFVADLYALAERPVAPPPSTPGGGDQVPELHAACWEIRWPSTPEGFEEIKCHGTNAVQDYRDHVHPEARSRELVYKDEAIAYAGARVAAETSALRAELDALKLKTRYRMGVGDGAGQLFVYGDYDSIKAAQQTVFRAETAGRERDDAIGIVAVILQDGGQRAKAVGNRQAIGEAHAEWCKLVRDLDEARAEAERLRKDAERLNSILSNSWDLRCFEIRTAGGDDADIGWRIVEHRRAEPRERTVAEVYRDDPRAAIDAAILADRGGESQ
jgi:hypothetical protein